MKRKHRIIVDITFDKPDTGKSAAESVRLMLIGAGSPKTCGVTCTGQDSLFPRLKRWKIATKDGVRVEAGFVAQGLKRGTDLGRARRKRP